MLSVQQFSFQSISDLFNIMRLDFWAKEEPCNQRHQRILTFWVHAEPLFKVSYKRFL